MLVSKGELAVDFSKKKKYDRKFYLEVIELCSPSGTVLSISDFLNAPNVSATVMRHDVDHDIYEALRMAQWEADRGFSSTYCILHTAWYYGELEGNRYKHSNILKTAVKELNAMGHEINFHNNLIGEAFRSGHCDAGWGSRPASIEDVIRLRDRWWRRVCVRVRARHGVAWPLIAHHRGRGRGGRHVAST